MTRPKLVWTFKTVLGVVMVAGCGSADTDTPRERTVVDDAFTVCEAMKSTGMVSECSVSGFNRTIDVRIDTSGTEARKICDQSSAMITAKSPRFRGEWELRVFSPFSGDHPLASCRIS